jgi:aspartate/tyrosine/aromatic aminotransferase
MFETLSPLPPDPILGVTAAYRNDPSDRKVDLGVGVYRDPEGGTPVPAAVREAERQVLSIQASKVYVGPHGNLGFNASIARLALGPVHAALTERIATIQTVGGCGALRVGAELLRAAGGTEVTIHVSDPTWANHEPLIGSAGVRIERYPYHDAESQALRFDDMLAQLSRLPAGHCVLVHACCHNPTGADLELAQWQALTELLVARGLVPFVDLAYQGLGDSLETDVAGVRHLAARVPEMLLAISCSKNFGLYRERVGALVAITKDAAAASVLATHQARTGRRMYSMPPDHGAAIVARVLEDAALRADWEAELAGMTRHLAAMRALLAERLAAHLPDRDLGWLTRQRGMFSLLGLPPAAIAALRSDWHVYTPPDGRINVAGLSRSNVDYVAEALASVARSAA